MFPIDCFHNPHITCHIAICTQITYSETLPKLIAEGLQKTRRAAIVVVEHIVVKHLYVDLNSESYGNNKQFSLKATIEKIFTDNQRSLDV